MRAHQDLVFSTAVRLLGNAAEAEDVAQTVFLKAYEHFAELAQNPAAGAWLRTVATNLALNHLTRYRARWRLFSELVEPESEVDFADLQPGPDDLSQSLEGADERRLLEAALDRLPAAQRVPLVLFHFEELSYEQIAARLRVSLAKVKTDIHRGREALRRVILRHFPNLAEPAAGAPGAGSRPEGEPPQPSARTFRLSRSACGFGLRLTRRLWDHAAALTPCPHAL